MTPGQGKTSSASEPEDMPPTLWAYCTVEGESIFVRYIYYWGA